MSNGDALNDMPEEYKEYKYSIELDRERDSNISAPFDPSAVAQSEADKAIADGKPRWVLHTDLGWKYIRFRERVQIKDDVCLRYNHCTGVDFAAYDMTEACVLEILPYGEIPPPAVPEKPKAVASVQFQYDGGEWLHMAEHIDIHNPPHEGIDHRGERIFIASSCFFFTLGGCRLGLVPNMPGDGKLRVVMLSSEVIYEGKASVDKRHDVWEGDAPFTESITFSMQRDEKPTYKPDLLPDGLSSLNRCPDCDNTLEQRSMPEGIEEWCGECNMKVEEKKRWTGTWKIDLSDDNHDIASERWKWKQGMMSGEWYLEYDYDRVSFAPCESTGSLAQRIDATDLQSAIMEAAPELVDLARDVVEEYGHFKGTVSTSSNIVELIWWLRDHDIPVAEWYKGGRNFPRDWRIKRGVMAKAEPTTAEGPMHPDMIRAELQKAIDGGYRMDIFPKAKYPQLKSRGELICQIVDGMVSMYTENTGLFAYMNLDMIQSVKPYRSG